MQFHTYSSPHLPAATGVSALMRRVLYALIPGAVCLTWVFGWGVLINLLISTLTCLGAEALMLLVRRRAVLPTLTDNSALVTAVLLGLALPPLAPWWIPVVGSLFAIVVAKHLYGGLGYNPFNPAMVGYVVLLISFPLEMTLWAAPSAVAETRLGLSESLHWVFGGALPQAMSLDAISAATPLDTIKTQLGLGRTLAEITASPLFGGFGGRGWEWVNLWFLLGGLWLLYKRIIHWHIPVAMLGSLFLMAFVFMLVDADTFASPLTHWFSGASMLGAFFIATDPVSAATTVRGRIIYGAGIGILTYVIRTWGGYPDAVAFAVLLMNMAAPTIDYYTQPRVFGQGDDES